MFSSKDFEKCWFLYQSEGLPYNLSIEEFCLKQGVPVNEFNKWYRDTHKRIHPIQVNGAPVSEAKEENPGEQPSTKGSVRITVTEAKEENPGEQPSTKGSVRITVT